LLTLAVSAADHKPSITVSAPYGSKYEIVVDGKSYFDAGNINISYLWDGNHTIQVFKSGRGFYGKRKMMVSSSSFFVRNNDIMISVDMGGQIRINESKYDVNRDDRGRDLRNSFDKDQGRGSFDHKKGF
jgi:hypothetical protein